MGLDRVIKPQNTEKQETPMPVDWSGILRYSFLFSQGSEDTQDRMFSWLAAGPLHGQAMGEVTSSLVAAKVGRYAEGISLENDNRSHIRRTGDDGTRITQAEFHANAKGELKNLITELKELDNLSAEERQERQRVDIGEIAQGFLERDNQYLKTGRPVEEGSKRDRWSSFVIDFGILHKGDGKFSWKVLPEPYKQLWEDVMHFICERRSEDLAKLARIYLSKHPDLPAEDHKKITSYLTS
jgi:hypothetical protein